MNITILGAAGFIGTNLAISLAEENDLVLVDSKKEYFFHNPIVDKSNVKIVTLDINKDTDFYNVVRNSEVVFHLISTNNPTTSNKDIAIELEDNVAITINILEACKNANVRRIIFLSSGGTVYGECKCPAKEDTSTNPINTYGIQKLTIEKIIFLYSRLCGIDYRIVRLANPYGLFQRPNGKLGAITTFTYKAINSEPLDVYGDGNIIRDYIYIEDAVNAIVNISMTDTRYKIYNVGSGRGITLLEVIQCIQDCIGKNVKINFREPRNVDLRENYLDCQRYIDEFGEIESISLRQGIKRLSKYIIETQNGQKVELSD